MRRDPTPAEKALWERLRNRQLMGFKFRRQHPVERYIVDFCCPEARMVIEVDGGIHKLSMEEDAQRQERLEQLNMKVIRFENGRVLHDIDSVLSEIARTLKQRSSIIQ